MIISFKYKYLFVESPNTGSTAISAELCEKYDGQPILRKHSRYYEFVSAANKSARDFYVFSSIRNPIDAQVSIYYKYKNNHRNRYTNPAELKENGGSVTKTDLKRFSYIKSHNLTFHGYLKRFVKLPYDTWSRLSHKKFDYIIRYENIQEDFSNVLKKLGIVQLRPLPVINTTKKDKNYIELFDQSTYQLAANTFGPFMKKWGYHFPVNWGELKASRISCFNFEFFGFFKMLYWRLRPKSNRKERLELNKKIKIIFDQNK